MAPHFARPARQLRGGFRMPLPRSRRSGPFRHSRRPPACPASKASPRRGSGRVGWSFSTIESRVRRRKAALRRTRRRRRDPSRRSEEHTSELQSHLNLVCRLLLEKKNNKQDLAFPTNKKKKQKHS